MTMSTLFTIVSLILGFAVSMTATALLASALFPHWVDRATERIRRAPVRTFLVGLVSGGLCTLLSAAVSQGGGPRGLVGAVMIAVTVGVALVGSAGVARSIADGLPSPVDRERPWKAIIRGWIVLAAASLLPVLGWFLVLPAALLIGFGAAILALIWRGPRDASSQPSAIEAGINTDSDSARPWSDIARIEIPLENAR